MKRKNGKMVVVGLRLRGKRLLKTYRVNKLVRVYQDMEKTLKALRQDPGIISQSIPRINLHKLVVQLSISKRRLERKISNTILTERRSLKRRLSRYVVTQLKTPPLTRSPMSAGGSQNGRI